METVTVSSKYQIVIPKEVREAMGIRPGQKLRVVPTGEQIRLVPDKPISAYRGILRGMDTHIEREEDRL